MAVVERYTMSVKFGSKGRTRNSDNSAIDRHLSRCYTRLRTTCQSTEEGVPAFAILAYERVQ